MRVWIDVDTPPQVQYLGPFVGAFRAAGAETVVTARDYGATVPLLRGAGIEHRAFGRRVGRGRVRKATAASLRAAHLRAYLRGDRRPDVLLAASRSSALAARALGIPSFIVGDYEHASVGAYRLTRSTILHPQVVDGEVFVRRGIRPDRVVAFRGLKEDLTFAGVDVAAVPPYDLGPLPADAVRVLFRPPSETSHYYRAASTDLARAALAHLARTGALVVFSPREPEQARALAGLPWRHPPVVLERPAPFVALLKSVDAVVCAGGTILREAAYLGIPAYGILRSEIGGVDRWLERIGRARLITDEAGLAAMALRPRTQPLHRLDANPRLLDELVGLVLAAVPAPAPPARLAPAT
jgi:predicted glycosyltransferase